MDPLEWVLAFVNQISGPAKAMTGSVRELTKALKELQGVSDKLKPIVIPGMTHKGGKGGGSGKAFSEATDGWTKAAKAAEKANASILKGVAQVEREQARANTKLLQGKNREATAAARAVAQRQKIEQNYSQWWDRELAKRERASDRAMKAELRNAAKIASAAVKAAERAAKARAKADEKASHKWILGGHKSIGGLAKDRLKSKVGGIAGGALDSLMGVPGSILSGAAGAAGFLVEGTAKAAVSLGQMAISAQALREDSVSGFTAIYGSSKAANDLFDAARTAAKQTKFDTDEVVRDFNTIAASGFAAKDIERIYWSSADIGSARGAGRQQRYLNALSKINASPQASFGAVQQAALAGPGIGNVFNALQDKMGIKGGPLSRKKWMDMFKDGKVSGATALESVIAATNKLYNKTTGLPGEYAKALGDKSWAGTISNIKNGLGDVLNMQLADDHPINKFKVLLQAIGSSGGLFDQTSARGKRFAKLMSDVVSDIFMPFGGIDLKNTGNVMDRILDAAEELRKRFHKMMEEITAGTDSFLKNARGSIITLAEDIGVAIARGFGKAASNVAGSIWQRTGGAVSEGLYNLIDPHAHEGQTLGTDLMDQPRGVAHSTPYEPSTRFSGPVRSYDVGGEVPGPYGRPQLAVVHGKERIIPLGASKSNGYGNSIGGSGSMGASGPPQVVVNFHGPVGADPGAVQEAIKQATYAGYMQALEEAAAGQGLL